MQLEIKGKKWGLEWGTGALENLCDDLGLTLQDIDHAIMMNETKVLNRLVYSALKNWCECQEPAIELDFNYKVFLKWLDDAPEDTGKTIMDDFLKSKLLGKTMEDRYNEIIERLNASENEVDVKKVKKKNTPSVK